ncbi:terminase [Clostridium estertheticum]|nr:terminase [Clostridium estertheticum]MBU3215859.1 terminase [Clostridium estertheticum]WAG57815.1 terminase [Clostridium estertheticum]
MLKLKFLWKDENKILWIQTFVKIVDKNKKVVPFILTKEQKYFIDNLGRENVILKGRQIGLTTCTIALMIRECVIHPNSSCLMVSYDQKSCNDVFDKLKEQYNSLPSWLSVKLVANNRQELKLINGSKITCVCAGNNDLGRGGSKSFVHFTEFAFVKDASRHLSSVRKTLTNNSTLILESTANGINLHHDLFFKAKNKEISMKDFFFSWINASSLFAEKYRQATEEYMAIHDNVMLDESDFDEEEKELVELGCTIPQLIWRRREVGTDGIEKFHQEYPNTPIQAFIQTGSSIFDSKRVNQAMMALKLTKVKPIAKANIILPIELKLLYGKDLFIWELPKIGEKYSIGVDMSEGLNQDYHVIEVFNQDMVQCAEFANNKIKPWEMATIINSIGHFYNRGLLCIERASGGGSAISRLRKEYKYMNMLKYKTFDEFNRPKLEIGFDTNTKTKSVVVNDFLELFDKHLMVINSERLLGEMQTFVSENNKMSATSGNHDDLIMSVCMAIQSHKQKFQYKW